MGHPTIYPTGVTVYDPERSWNGFTIFQAQEGGAVLMDMNGREVNVWKGVHGMLVAEFLLRFTVLRRIP